MLVQSPSLELAESHRALDAGPLPPLVDGGATSARATVKLSIVIPVYNEAATIREIVDQVPRDSIRQGNHYCGRRLEGWHV